LFALVALSLAVTHLRTNMLHKYKIRQMVRLVRAPISDSRASGSGIYEVTRLMPADETGEVSYRIKSGATERAVRESEIRA
jgi:DNA polymerase III delta prime subunit